MFFIYTLSDPRTDAVRYVGHTHRPFIRFNSHLQENKGYGLKPRWMSELTSQNLEPRMRIVAMLDGVDRDAARVLESQWVKYFIKIGAPLLNWHYTGKS